MQSGERRNAENLSETVPASARVMQRFLTEARWDDDAVMVRLQEYLAPRLAHPEAVWVLDGSDFPKQGRKSAGVARQYCGRLGKVASCQAGMFLAYVSPLGRALVDKRLYLKDDAVIFMGRLTRDPNDIRVFGWAIGMQHKPGRDDATLADIELRPWKEQWSLYIRVDRAEFVAGTMVNGVSLNELMDTLEAYSFASTQRNATHRRGNTNPRYAYRQQAAVELSAEGHSWLSERLQVAFEVHGKVSQDSLDELDWPDPYSSLIG